MIAKLGGTLRELGATGWMQVLSVHHATILTFAGGAAKIVENHLGRAWVQVVQQIMVQVQGPPAGGPAAPGPTP